MEPRKERKIVEFEQTSEGKREPQALGMSKPRFLFSNGIIVFLITCSLVALAIDIEPWPFSNYPMYSYLVNGTGEEYSLEKPQLYGVMQEEPHQEIPMHYDYIKPLDEGRVHNYFLRIQEDQLLTDLLGRPDPGAGPEQRQWLLDEACRDFLRQYETLRLAGSHDGPPLQGVRLYRQQWQLDPRAENVDHPDHRELLAECEKSQDDR